MTPNRELFRACACCPNQCRMAMSPGTPMQAESLTPSALSLIALAVTDGQLPADPQLRAALGRTAEARACVALCPYGFDVPAAIDQFVAELPNGPATNARSA